MSFFLTAAMSRGRRIALTTSAGDFTANYYVSDTRAGLGLVCCKRQKRSSRYVVYQFNLWCESVETHQSNCTNHKHWRKINGVPITGTGVTPTKFYVV